MPPDPRFYPPEGPFTLSQLAEISGAEIAADIGDNRSYDNVSPLSLASIEEVSFLDNKAYLGQFREAKAGCCIVHPNHVSDAPEHMDILASESVYLAYARVATAFHPDWDELYIPVSPEDRVHQTASVGAGTVIGAGATVAPDAEIGRNCLIGPNVYIGRSVQIGDNCRIGPSASIRSGVIGNGVTLYAGARIGEAGFGFAASDQGAVSVPQVGRVLIGDGVEIGANTTIDRGSGPDTVIGAGTRIDNLVQIGHNVQIGRMCIIVGQAGVAGSTKIGDGVQIGGQSGLAGHLNIGNGARIAGGSGVMRDVGAGEAVVGAPAVPVKQFFRQTAAVARLVKKKDS